MKPFAATGNPALVFLLILAVGLVRSHASEARFYRGLNLNGPAVTIDGNSWEHDQAKGVKVTGSAFENQTVPLKPPTDPDRAKMIRSSRWGSAVDVELAEVPDAEYQLFLYVWEDNQSERFNLLLNGAIVLEGFNSGRAGVWKKLGPWATRPFQGKIKVGARGGAANLSGIEVWQGTGEVPTTKAPQFVTALTAEHTEFFEKRIRPLLVENCYECHSAGARKIGANLLLDSRAGVIKGGETGPAIYPGLPQASLLIQAIRHTDPDLKMPPKVKLSALQIADLEQWVKLGAPDPRTNNTVAAVKAKSAIDWDKARQWWAFRPFAGAKVPEVRQSGWAANEIDRFILARLEKEGLAPARDAHKRVLIRRATFDLIGLPPTPEEITEFLHDNSPQAFAKVIDRLLGSPDYGQRWGRHWLDVVRYSDCAGDNSDFPIPQMYRYRNWVIDAFNRDLPYDQFIREQLAGDLLPADSEPVAQTRLIATGYIANARRFGSRVSDYPQHLTIEDTIDNLGRAFLGLTVSCARCHDHKFDPITSADYYALYGIFDSTRYPWPGIELEQTQRDLVPLVPQAEVDSVLKSRAEEQARLEAEVKRLENYVKGSAGDNQKELEKQLTAAKKAVERFQRRALPFEQAYAVAEAGKSGDAAIQLKGDPAKLGDRVRRRFLTVLRGPEVPPSEKGSGRRHLADAITSAENPLTARVIVNRIWLYHFGQGIVSTPNDFGRQGKPPTHPELLDWLAKRFIHSGWSIKEMHRSIMLSRTYQLSGERTAESIARDPNNHLLSGFPRRRLDAESIRDSMLALGGNLDAGPAGPHPFPPQEEWNFTQHNPFKAVYPTRHRSVYLMTQRTQRHPFLAIFDGADPAASTGSRLISTTPLQALYLLNDPFVHEQARQFAARLASVSTDDGEKLRRAYELALGRPPTLSELDAGRTFLASVRVQSSASEPWEAFARVLFRLNEFVYVD